MVSAARTSSSSRQSRRQSSGSNSISSSAHVTIKPTDKLRSSSTSRPAGRPLDIAALSYEASTTRSASKKRTSSPSKRRSSNIPQSSEVSGVETYGHQNQGSRSTNSSSSTTGDQRNSNYSKRFSLGMSPLSSLHNAQHRSLSPQKVVKGLNKTSSPTKANEFDLPSEMGVSDATSATTAGQKDASFQKTSPPGNDPVRGEPTETENKIARLKDRFEPSKWRDDGSSTSGKRKEPVVEMTERPPRSGESSFPQQYRNKTKDLNPGTSHDDHASLVPKRSRSRLEKDKKAMLAMALQRANDAVLLDNSQDYTKAIEAYTEACDLLSQVMVTSTSDDDKRKLRTIRSTYTSRVAELEQLDKLPQAEQAESNLPATSSSDPSKQPSGEAEESRFSNERNIDAEQRERATKASERSLDARADTTTTSNNSKHKPVFSGSSLKLKTGLAPPMDSSIMPPPLSPGRSPPSEYTPEFDTASHTDAAREASDTEEEPVKSSTRTRKITESGISWLDSIDESVGSSTSSSHHSMSSMNGLHRKHLRMRSDDTGAEFDAAFDAAVEAAYDDGYEPYFGSEADRTVQHSSDIDSAKAEGVPRPLEQATKSISSRPASDRDSPRNSDDTQILDDVVHESPLDDQSYDSQNHNNIPRQSDSSGFSGRTYGSSGTSSFTTPGTSLSPVGERGSLPSISSQLSKIPTSAPPAPPPTTTLPPPPTSSKPPSPDSSKQSSMQSSNLSSPQLSTSVRDRRLSPQKAKRLKIETTVPHPQNAQDESIPPVPQLKPTQPQESTLAPPRFTSNDPQGDEQSGADRIKSQSATLPLDMRQISSPYPSPFPGMFPRSQSHEGSNTGLSPETPALSSAFSQDSLSVRPSPQSGSPATSFAKPLPDRPPKKTPSSLSLRKTTLAPSVGTDLDFSPGTPMSISFSTAPPSMRPSKVPMNTPVVGTFPLGQTQIQPQQATRGNLTIFENEIHSPTTPGSPNTETSNAPKALEPCPESFLLRPFWLMRCIYQTLTHPRGGYVSTKLFIPREVWEVKHVKLKGIEEKIATCDLLSAALMKLNAVDTLDADAVLQEMQSFENVLDQAQTNLSKKLGNEVGVQSISSLFNNAPTTNGTTNSNDGNQRASGNDSTNERSSGTKSSSKTYLSSWRKLRSKNSSANMAGHFTMKDNQKESLTMKSVPMTSIMTQSSRHHKKDGPVVKPDGPNANYMGALTKLCDAAQILDQIARQVEDPGLKHSSPTHVGLELCARHASEFFGFYICRFMIQDLTTLTEKHIKRATEWALS